MARPQRKQNKKQGSNKLLEAGAAFTFAGVVILLLPLFLSSPILRPLALSLRSLGWPLMAVGAVLLGIYFAVKSKISAAQLPNSDNATSQRIEPMLKPTAASTAVYTPATSWSADVFAAIEWRRFEAVCEALFAQAGFSARAQSHGARFLRRL